MPWIVGRFGCEPRGSFRSPLLFPKLSTFPCGRPALHLSNSKGEFFCNLRRCMHSKMNQQGVICEAHGNGSATSKLEHPQSTWEDGQNGLDISNRFVIGVLGDLHLESGGNPLFQEAKEQVLNAIGLPTVAADDYDSGDGVARRIVQVGDLGGYTAEPGSQACFDRARDFLDAFPVPKAMVLGNHDLEGAEFETDEDNICAWSTTFRQRHYWAMDCGSCVCIGLSTVQFRAAEFSCHEVFVDETQVKWFEETLARYHDRNVFVFTHAPPMGSGLKVLQEIHVKNRCAWLNHSEDPSKFIDIVGRNPQIRLWLSGHFHLSHNYRDSISVVGRCAFVQVGVIGEDSSRDGFRHSRILKGNSDGYEVFTLDHDTGELRLDLSFNYSSKDSPQPEPIPPPEELLCHPNSGFLCALDDCDLDGEHVQWFPAGPKSIMSVQQDMLVEYDPQTRAAIGLVALDVKDCKVSLLDQGGQVVSSCDSDSVGDGLDAVMVQIRGKNGHVNKVYRNKDGGFYQIFQENKWVARKKMSTLLRK